MKDLEYYKKLNYKMVFEYNRQDNVYVVRFPDLPGCIAHGETPEEALQYAIKVKNDWIEEAFESNWPVPEPSEILETSGRITLRIPKYVHHNIINRAEEEGVSQNQLILSFIAGGLQKLETQNTLKEIMASQQSVISRLDKLIEAGSVSHLGTAEGTFTNTAAITLTVKSDPSTSVISNANETKSVLISSTAGARYTSQLSGYSSDLDPGLEQRKQEIIRPLAVESYN